MTPTPIALRVARRHQAAIVLRDAPAATTRVEYSSSGRISAVELMRMLEPELGVLVGLRFRRSLEVDPNGIEWEGLDEEGNLVSGRLTLHASLSETEVVTWGEVIIHRPQEHPEITV
jgi:hypothetical protein